MALKQLAAIALRLRRAWWFAALPVAVVALGGCGAHRRDSLRPVYTTPSTAGAPCTNCGAGGGAVVNSPAAGSGSSEPVIETPSGSTESNVPNVNAPAGAAQPPSRSSLPEERPGHRSATSPRSI